MAFYLTLSHTNEFRFECPVFNAQTKMASCMVLRDAVWAGRYVEKRKGCQVAMRCGMCPAARIVDKISYSRDVASDDYGSLEPKVGKLNADILDKILRVIPIPSELERGSISPEERQLLLTTRTRIEAQLKSAPKSPSYVAPKQIRATIYEAGDTRGDRARRTIVTSEARSIRDVPAKTAPKINQTINEAARTGDMSAAINAAA